MSKPPTWTQTLARMEQTWGESDQTLNDRDEQAPDDALAGPQRGSDHGAGPVAHVRASAARASPARECDETPGLRDQAARERDVHAQQRDQLSMRRDEFAKVRDSEARDLDAGEIVPGEHTLLVKELRARPRQAGLRGSPRAIRTARRLAAVSPPLRLGVLARVRDQRTKTITTMTMTATTTAMPILRGVMWRLRWVGTPAARQRALRLPRPYRVSLDRP